MDAANRDAAQRCALGSVSSTGSFRGISRRDMRPQVFNKRIAVSLEGDSSSVDRYIRISRGKFLRIQSESVSTLAGKLWAPIGKFSRKSELQKHARF